MKRRPTVSIVTIAYNQERYIGQALESFVMQQTDFDFEIIVADDCSTDKTAQIIADYAKKYPDLFRPILRAKNIGIQANMKDALQHARGQYLALCEGDDYWTDPKKLQKQVDLLESHPEYALCFHPVRVFFENHEQEDSIAPSKADMGKGDAYQLLKGNFIYTNSVLYRTQQYNDMPLDIIPLDWYLHLFHAQFGKIGFIDEVMSDYRRHPGGIWWASSKDVDIIWHKYGLAHFTFFVELLKLFADNKKYREVVLDHLDEAFTRLAMADKKFDTQQLATVIHTYPDITAECFVRLMDRQGTHQTISEKTHSELDTLRSKLTESETLLQQRTQELSSIKRSRVWKLRNKLSRATARRQH